MEPSDIWEVLVEECGARADERDDFVRSAQSINPTWGLEYRFMGDLGFGGKVYVRPRLDRWEVFVSQYIEDETEISRAQVAAAMARFEKMGFIR